MKPYLIVTLILLVAGIAYLMYLDWGCEFGGVMTWEGKQCITLN